MTYASANKELQNLKNFFTFVKAQLLGLKYEPLAWNLKLFYYCPCPSARDLGSRVYGLVLIKTLPICM